MAFVSYFTRFVKSFTAFVRKLQEFGRKLQGFGSGLHRFVFDFRYFDGAASNLAVNPNV